MSSLIVLEMPGIYGLKPRFQALLRPFAWILAHCGVTANQVTIVACVLSIASGLIVFITMHFFLFLPFVFLIRMAMNVVDGILAREFGQQTRLGAHLNELTDVVSDTFLYLPFTQLAGIHPTAIWFVIVLSVISEMAGTVAVSGRRYDGPMGKSDRALVFSTAALWVGFAGGLPAPVANLFPIILSLLLALTIVNRVRKSLEENQHAAI
jgi:CDP-diacylglycerol--glycerol-3-phosphate 3-phosphatidyltransferase